MTSRTYRSIRTVRTVRTAALSIALMLVTSAHVGTRNVVFQGEAGAYPVTVVIRPPEVVPGLADISIRVEGEGVERVTVQPVRWDAGPETGAPRPDVATPVSGAEGLFSAELWLMTTGAYRVTVVVAGSAGGGEVVVPITSIASGVLDMPRGLGWVLVGLSVFLFFGAVTIFGAAARESVLDADESPTASSRRRGVIAMAIGAISVAALAFGLKTWWDSVDAAARSGIFQPLQVEAAARVLDGAAVLEIAITDPEWLGRGYSPLVPDHGKLMHMFIVGAPGMEAFAHVHPVPVDSATFRVAWPNLPPGEYRVYGDIVHETGFSQTVVDTIVVDAVIADAAATDAVAAAAERASARPGIVPDPDDSSWTGVVVGTDAGSSTDLVATLPDGATMTWVGGRAGFSIDRETSFRFEVRNTDGSNARLEPYMGMASHAAVTRNDGAVFVHLHPSGTISMGSLSVLKRRAQGDPTLRRVIRNDPDEEYEFMRPEAGEEPAPAGTADISGVLEFPFAFPRGGDYTVWVQVKRDGQVQTAAFQVLVTAS